MTIRVLLADDQVLLRSSLAALIEQEDDMEVVGEAADGDEAVRLALRHRPDVVACPTATGSTRRHGSSRTPPLPTCG